LPRAATHCARPELLAYDIQQVLAFDSEVEPSNKRMLAEIERMLAARWLRGRRAAPGHRKCYRADRHGDAPGVPGSARNPT
jgi:hypothetical protein